MLWRVHGKCRQSADFTVAGPDARLSGGRFDSTPDDRYPYLYAAPEQQTALLETLVRSVPFDDGGHRVVRRAAIAGCRLSALQLSRDLTLVCLLTAVDLATVYQDEWLVQAEPSEYPQTRRWGHWLRAQAPWAQGFLWPSRRDLGRQVLVLFGDRCPAGALRAVAGTSVELDSEAGAAWLNRRLAPYRVSV
jgi:RES domain